MRTVAFSQVRTAARLSSPRVAKSRLFPYITRFAKPVGRLSPCKPVVLRCFSASAPMASSTRVVEHVVLFKVKEGISVQQQEAMVSGLRSLKGLPTVTELSAGKAVQVWSAAFTHALHARYMSKEELDTYASDPFHVDVINRCILPVVEDRLAIDWEADVEDPIPGSSSYGAVRIAALKPKEDLAASELSEIMDMLKDYKSRFPLIKEVSVGKNFCSRSQGYEWAFLALFSSAEELEELSKNEEHVRLMYAKVLPAMEKFAVVDYHTT